MAGTALAIRVLLLTSLALVLGYTTRWDTIDLEKLLHNDKLVDAYVSCLMDHGECTQEGAELKRVLPHALATGCSNCTELQRIGAEKIIDFLRKHRPEDWKRLRKHFDPHGVYIDQYADKLKP